MISVGPFELLEPVARGGMGEVWRARHAIERITVAVKVITAERAREASYLAALNNEVRAMARLDHPGIVLVLDHGLVPQAAEAPSRGALVAGSPYVAMEWADGGSLKNRKPISSWQMLRRTLVNLLDALAHAHARNVVHRDIKPSNVLVEARGRASLLKLSDFGVAFATGEAAADTFSSGGTPAYMAPEQIEGDLRDQGPWTDLYALGCLTYWLASGSPPYSGDSYAVCRAHLFEPRPRFEPLFEVPRAIEDWVERLLAKDPRERFETAADAAHELLALRDTDLMPRTSSSEGFAPARPIERDSIGPDAPSLGFAEPSPLRGTARSRRQSDRPTVSSPATGPSAEGLGVALEATTLLVPIDGATPRSPSVPPLRTDGPREIPADWRLRAVEARPLQLLGAGLALYGLRPIPLAGREAERDRLWAALLDVGKVGRPRAVVVSGQPGHGKTRLAEWLSERARELGAARVLSAECDPQRGPGHALVELYLDYFRARGDRPRLIAGLSRLLEVNDATSLANLLAASGLEAAPTSLAERLTRLRQPLFALARDRPAILFLDDAHADPEALAFTSALLRVSRPLKVLVVLTVREDLVAESSMARAILERVLAHGRAEELPIGPLPSADHADLVKNLLLLEGDAAREVAMRTDGNALFAVQLVGDWVSRGLLASGQHGFRLRDGVAAELPDDLHALWNSRIARVIDAMPDPSLAERALELAAVLGARNLHSEWRLAAELEGFAIPTDLAGSLHEHRLATDDGIEFAFVHGMLRESLERRARERARSIVHHDACARMLERMHGADDGAVRERIALHLYWAERYAECLDPLLAAAELRMLASDYGRARTLLAHREQALAAIGALREERPVAIGVVKRGAIAARQGHFDEALAAFAEVEPLLERDGETQLLAEMARYRGLISMKRGQPDALDQFERALALFQALGNERSIADCVHGSAEVLKFRGHIPEAKERFERAIEMGRRLGDQRRTSFSLSGLSDIYTRMGDYPKALSLLAEAVSVLDRGAGAHTLLVAINDMGDVARKQGDLDAAERYYLRAVELSEELGLTDVVIIELNLGLLSLARADYPGALARFTKNRAELVESGHAGYLGYADAGLLACAAALRDFAEWDRRFGSALRHILETDVADTDIASALALAADLAREAGEISRAKDAYELAAEQWRRLGRTEEAERVLDRRS